MNNIFHHSHPAWKQAQQQSWILPYVPPTSTSSGESRQRVAGVDLGQSHDFAALAVLEKWRYSKEFLGPILPHKQKRTIVQKLSRWPIGTAYLEIAEDLAQLDVDVIAVEYNGVGQPVYEMVRAAVMRVGNPARVMGVIHTGSQMGQSVRSEGRHGGLMARKEREVWYVPKASMVSSIEIAQQQGQYLFPPHVKDSPGYREFEHELGTYRTRISKSTTGRAHKSFGNKEGVDEHDDVIVAIGIATYVIARVGKRTLDQAVPM